MVFTSASFEWCFHLNRCAPMGCRHRWNDRSAVREVRTRAEPRPQVKRPRTTVPVARTESPSALEGVKHEALEMPEKRLAVQQQASLRDNP